MSVAQKNRLRIGVHNRSVWDNKVLILNEFSCFLVAVIVCGEDEVYSVAEVGDVDVGTGSDGFLLQDCASCDVGQFNPSGQGFDVQNVRCRVGVEDYIAAFGLYVFDTDCAFDGYRG